MAQDTCALRRAGPADVQRIEAFLANHSDTSMYLRSNLMVHGLEPSEAAHATQMFVHTHRGSVQGVLGLTTSGYLLAQLPVPDIDLSPARTFWHGRRVVGMTGIPAQVDRVLLAMGLANEPMKLDRLEPLYALDLAALSGKLDRVRTPTAVDTSLLDEWFETYRGDTGLAGMEEDKRADALTRTRRAVETAGLRLLDIDGQTVAMTAFNAEIGDTVHVSGVFVPRNLRNRGYGRRVVAAHLAEAYARGIQRAILFAASQAAARAYEGIGFQRIGTYRVTLFAAPAIIQGAS